MNITGTVIEAGTVDGVTRVIIEVTRDELGALNRNPIGRRVAVDFTTDHGWWCQRCARQIPNDNVTKDKIHVLCGGAVV